MELRLLWLVLAGVLLGFALSTLWEWLYFRRKRMKLNDARVQELEAKLKEQEQLLEDARLSTTQAVTWPTPDYQSPAVFLETEEVEEPDYVAYTGVEETGVADYRPLRARRVEPEPLPQAAAHAPLPAQSVEEPAQSLEEMPRGVGEAEPFPNQMGGGVGEAAPIGKPDAGGAGEAEEPIRQERRAAVIARTENYPDDLAKIKGIGDVYKVRLYASGIYTWHQVGVSDLDALRTATHAYPSANVEEWPEQAHKLAEKHGRQNANYTGPLPDDLTKITGIGPVSRQTLYQSGVCTYEQLASVLQGELEELFPIAVAGDQPDFGSWIEQAIRLAQAKRQT